MRACASIAKLLDDVNPAPSASDGGRSDDVSKRLKQRESPWIDQRPFGWERGQFTMREPLC